MGWINQEKGKLVVVSGLDGCGKSRLCTDIFNYLRNRKIPSVMSSAISGSSTTIGRQIGDILRDPQTECPIPPDAEHALMIAARVLAEKNRIEPALKEGKWVISDRYGICGRVYQRDSKGDFMKAPVYNMRLSLFGLGRLPDLEIVLDIDPAHPHKPHDPDNRLEDRPLEEWQDMRTMYKLLARSQPNTYILDGHEKPAEIFERVRPYLEQLI